MKYETGPWEWPEDLDPEDVLWIPDPRTLPPGESITFNLPQPGAQSWWRTLVADYNAWRSHR